VHLRRLVDRPADEKNVIPVFRQGMSVVNDLSFENYRKYSGIQVTTYGG
jgi:hypothetical protein